MYCARRHNVHNRCGSEPHYLTFMLNVLLQAPRPIPLFNEPARDLRIQNKPLWLNHNFLDRQQGFIVTPDVEGEVETTTLMPLAIGILTPKIEHSRKFARSP